MNTDPKQVSGEETQSPVAADAVTPETAAEVAQSTPADRQEDAAEILKQEALKLRDDINKMKSVFQKREAQMEKEFKTQQRKLEEQLETARVAGMDEDARKAYEATRGNKKVGELEEELSKLRSEKESAENYRNAIDQFLEAGVPKSALADTGDLNELVNSGWNWMIKHQRELKEELEKLKTPKSAQPLPVPPKVDTLKAGGSTTKPTWADLEKTYGSRERVYELVEARRLSPDIIP